MHDLASQLNAFIETYPRWVQVGFLFLGQFVLMATAPSHAKPLARGKFATIYFLALATIYICALIGVLAQLYTGSHPIASLAAWGIDLAIFFVAGYLITDLARMRARDAYKDENYAWMIFIPFANLVLLFKQSASDESNIPESSATGMGRVALAAPGSGIAVIGAIIVFVVAAGVQASVTNYVETNFIALTDVQTLKVAMVKDTSYPIPFNENYNAIGAKVVDGELNVTYQVIKSIDGVTDKQLSLGTIAIDLPRHYCSNDVFKRFLAEGEKVHVIIVGKNNELLAQEDIGTPQCAINWQVNHYLPIAAGIANKSMPHDFGNGIIATFTAADDMALHYYYSAPSAVVEAINADPDLQKKSILTDACKTLSYEFGIGASVIYTYKAPMGESADFKITPQDCASVKK